MARMTLSVIGGGSVNWMPGLMRDLYMLDIVEGGEIRLIDPNQANVEAVAALLRTWNHERDKTFIISTHPDFHGVLGGSDFVLTTFSPGSMDGFLNDLELPIRFGVRQPVSMTVGPCGISAALRTVPVAHDIVLEMERCCPEAWLLNVTNPMGAVIQGMGMASRRVRFLGMCHEYHAAMTRYVGGMIELAKPDGMKTLDYLYRWLPEQGVRITIAGLNHFIWLTGFWQHEEDLLPRVRAYCAAHESFGGTKSSATLSMANPFDDSGMVKLALCRQFGYLPMVGDRHLVEFIPSFCNAQNGYGMRYRVFKTTVDYRKMEKARQLAHIQQLSSGQAKTVWQQSSEETAPIVEAILTGKTIPALLNLPNIGQVENLPLGIAVETFATVGPHGAIPQAAGALPGAVGTLCRLQADVQSLTVRAALEGDRSLFVEALSLDPMTSSMDFAEIGALADTLLTANRAWLPRFYQ